MQETHWLRTANQTLVNETLLCLALLVCTLTIAQNDANYTTPDREELELDTLDWETPKSAVEMDHWLVQAELQGCELITPYDPFRLAMKLRGPYRHVDATGTDGAGSRQPGHE